MFGSSNQSTCFHHKTDYIGIIPESTDVRFTIFHGWLGLEKYSDVNIQNEIVLFTATAAKQQVYLHTVGSGENYL